MTLPIWAAQPQRGPLPGGDSVLDDLEAAGVVPVVVMDALHVREVVSQAKYGDRLRTHNGRSAELDYAQEQLDAVNYAWRAGMESKGWRRLVWRFLARVAAWSALAAWWLGGER